MASFGAVHWGILIVIGIMLLYGQSRLPPTR